MSRSELNPRGVTALLYPSAITQIFKKTQIHIKKRFNSLLGVAVKGKKDETKGMTIEFSGTTGKISRWTVQ
jgi:hypothetical protein